MVTVHMLTLPTYNCLKRVCTGSGRQNMAAGGSSGSLSRSLYLLSSTLGDWMCRVGTEASIAPRDNQIRTDERSLMNMPGFTAEASAYKTTGSYHYKPGSWCS